MANNLDEILKYIKDVKEDLSVITPVSKVIDLLPDIAEIRDEYEDTELPEDVIAHVSLRIENAFTDIIKLLSLSVLCAEYISDIDFLVKLKQIVDKTEDLFDDFSSFPLRTHDDLIQFSSSVFISLELYKDFYNRIKNYYSEDRRDYVFISNKQLKNELKKESIHDKSLEDKINYFNTVIVLANTDHFPKNDNEHFIKLYKIKEGIEDVNIPSFLEMNKVIITKIEFLQYKWKERRLQENPYHSVYTEDGEERIIQDFKTDNQDLNNWLEVFNTQYGISTSTDYIINNRVRNYKNKELEGLKHFQIHQLIKCFKDVEPNQRRIEEIAKHLKNKIIEEDNFYDKHSLRVFVNYTLNNNFSKFIENKSDINEIKEKFDFTKSNIVGLNNNYFLEYKFLNRVLKLLMPKIEEEKQNFINKYKDIVNECEGIFESYSKNVEWSIKELNYIFALPFNESLIPFEIDNKTYKVFFASSFSLPPSVKEMEEQYKEIKKDVGKISSYTESVEYFSSEIKKINNLKEEIQKKDFKSIEIIGIFTAIVTFVLSTIPTFKFVETITQSLLFMLTLSSAMGIFVVLILFSTRGFDFKKNRSAWIFLLLLLLVGGIGYNSFKEFKVLNKENNRLKNEIKDLKKEKNMSLLQSTNSLEIVSL